MTSFSIPSYLYRSRHGIFYFRIRIPLFIQKKYHSNRREFRKSLNTRTLSSALDKSRRLYVTMEDTDYMMKQNQEIELFEENEGRKILREFLIAEIKSQDEGYFTDYNDDSELDVFFLTLSQNKKRLLKLALRQWEALSEEQRNVALKDIRNEVEQEKNIFESTIEPLKTINVSVDRFSDDLVSVKITEFINSSTMKLKRAKKAPADSTTESYHASYREFLFIIGNETKCCDLNKQLIKKYSDEIWEIPKNFTEIKKYDGMTIKQLVAFDVKDDEKKSASTIKKSVGFVKRFLKWAGRERYIENGLAEFFEPIPETENAHEKRDLFSDDELKLLFNNEVYENGKCKKLSRYWIPLIALLSGMRGQEISQLYKDDIEKHKETNIWCFNIVKNESRKQSLKTNSAKRAVPVHPQLIRLGFLAFVNDAENSSMLFPDLYRENGKNYKPFGNNFNRKADGWKVKCGVKNDKTSFHSFRHNVINQLERVGIEKRVICFLVGHRYAGGLVPNYIKPDDMKTLHKAVKLIKYPSIDWKKIEKRWG